MADVIIELPTKLSSMRFDLPWEIVVGDEAPIDVVRCDLSLTQQRVYSPNMLVAEYVNNGPHATMDITASLAVVVNRVSFSLEDPGVVGRLLNIFVGAYAHYCVTLVVAAQAPPGASVPPGVGWPLDAVLAEYINTGSSPGYVPVPRGSAAAFRFLPASEYATTDIVLQPSRREALVE